MRKKGSLLKELPILVVVALVVSLFIKTFAVQFFYIPSGSMENTLQIKDRVAVNKVPFLSKSISRGDVVVFRDPDNWLPEIIDYDTNKYVAKAKSALVAVGVLPNPAKQYLVKRVVGVEGYGDGILSTPEPVVVVAPVVEAPVVEAVVEVPVVEAVVETPAEAVVETPVVEAVAEEATEAPKAE